MKVDENFVYLQTKSVYSSLIYYECDMELEYVKYKGIEYPCKTLLLEDIVPYNIIVSVKALEDVLVDEDGAAIDKAAEYLDNKIAYYVNKPSDLQREAKDILNEIYS